MPLIQKKDSYIQEDVSYEKYGAVFLIINGYCPFEKDYVNIGPPPVLTRQYNRNNIFSEDEIESSVNISKL